MVFAPLAWQTKSFSQIILASPAPLSMGQALQADLPVIAMLITYGSQSQAVEAASAILLKLILLVLFAWLAQPQPRAMETAVVPASLPQSGLFQQRLVPVYHAN